MYGQSFEPKVIAVDFDETISDNPEGWLHTMKCLELSGYTVYVVTYRHETEGPEDLQFLVDKGYKVFYTGRWSKRDFMLSKGIKVNIFIDDTPETCIMSMDKQTGEFFFPQERLQWEATYSLK